MARKHRTTNATPLVITHHDMTTAYTRGEVTPLSPIITEFVQYAGHWWTIDPPGWLRITEEGLIRFLDQQKKQQALGLPGQDHTTAPAP